MTVIRSLLAVLTLLVTPLAAQLDVTPANRVVVLETGASAKVLVDAGPCDAAWTAASDDTDVVTVTPDAYADGSKRTFTLTAPEGQFSDSATVSLSLDGSKCLPETTVDIRVHVVAVAPKTVAGQFKKGIAGEGVLGAQGRLKTLKKDIKAAEKALAAAYKATLGELKAGTLALDELPPPPGGGASIQQHELALYEAWIAESEAVGALWTAWFRAVGGSASDGNAVLSAAGYLSVDREAVASVTSAAFLQGGGGLWEAVTLSAHASITRSLTKLDVLGRRFHAKVLKLAGAGARIHARRNAPRDGTRLLDGPTQLGFAPQIDPGLDTNLQILTLRAANHWQDGDNANGRIFVVGHCDPFQAIAIEFQQLVDGAPFGDPLIGASLPALDGTWVDVEPDILEEGALPAGTWRVTASDGTNEVIDVIDVPVQ